jgi:hypothetical protein
VKEEGRRKPARRCRAKSRPVFDGPGLQGVMWLFAAFERNCDRKSQRIDGGPRPRSGRRVGPARLTRRARRGQEARTAWPTKNTQEAPIVIYSMTTSTHADAPRGMGFLYSLNRLNVATSRAKALTILVCSPQLFEPECRTPDQMRMANAFCRYLELASVL